MSKEVDVGRVLFSYAQNEKRAKSERAQRRGTFVPEARDDARLMPRLRGAPRR